MNYEILETRIVFINNEIDKIFVLINCTGIGCKPYSDVRAIYATTNPKQGYMFISKSSLLNNELLQHIAAQGTRTYDRDKIFPGWKSFLPKE